MNRNSFYFFPSQSCCLSLLLSYLISLAVLSGSMIKQSDENRHSCLVLNSVEACDLSLMRMLAVWFLLLPFIRLRMFLIVRDHLNCLSTDFFSVSIDTVFKFAFLTHLSRPSNTTTALQVYFRYLISEYSQFLSFVHCDIVFTHSTYPRGVFTKYIVATFNSYLLDHL